MSLPYAVRVADLRDDLVVPGRFSEAGLRELAATLGGADDPDEDPWQALEQAFRALPPQELGERLLEAVLLQPPIPAGCEALLRAMTDEAHPPWIDHDVPEDRFQLWYCHHLVHRVFPDIYPAPRVRRVTLDIYQLDPSARPPGRRSPARDRTSFFARLLQGRPGDNPIAARHGADSSADWAFDVVWATEAAERAKATPDDPVVLEHGSPEIQPWRLTMDGWLPPQWIGDLAVGQVWLSSATVA